MIFEELSGAVLIQRNGLPRVFANILQRRRDRVQIPRRLPTAVLQRPAAAKKSGKGGGMIVTGPALEVAPVDPLILGVGKHQGAVALGQCGRSERKQDGHCRDNANDQKARDQTWRRTHPHCEHHCPVSVAMTFQFGSREDTSRAKVQTSVTSVTFSALPSITVPLRSRVAEISLDTKRTVICAVVRLRSSAAVMVEPSIDTKRVSALSLLRSRSVIAASNPSYTSRESKLRSCRRSPPAKAVTIIS